MLYTLILRPNENKKRFLLWYLFKAFDEIESSHKSDFLSLKRPIFLHACAAFIDFPSNMSWVLYCYSSSLAHTGNESKKQFLLFYLLKAFAEIESYTYKSDFPSLIKHIFLHACTNFFDFPSNISGMLLFFFFGPHRQ